MQKDSRFLFIGERFRDEILHSSRARESYAEYLKRLNSGQGPDKLHHDLLGDHPEARKMYPDDTDWYLGYAYAQWESRSLQKDTLSLLWRIVDEDIDLENYQEEDRDRRAEILTLFLERIAAAYEGGPPDLHEAAMLGNQSEVRELIGQGADLQARDAMGNSPLFYAISVGNFPMAEYLISLGARPQCNPEDEGMLHIAVDNQDLDAVSLLLKAGINPDCRDHEGRTPLLSLIGNGREAQTYPIAHLLLEANATVDATDQLGNTALMLASASGDLSLVQLLHRYGAKLHRTNQAGDTPLSIARENRHSETLAWLAKQN